MKIYGLPQKPKEDRYLLIADLAQKLEVPFYDSDIETNHRLPAKPEGAHQVCQQNIAREIDQFPREIKIAPGKQGHPFMQLCGNLTGFNKQLFWAAKQKGKEMVYELVGSKNWKLFVRQKKGASLIRVNGLAGIHWLVRQRSRFSTNVTIQLPLAACRFDVTERSQSFI